MKHLLTVAFLLAFGTLCAQQKANLNGTYILNKAKTDFKTEEGQAPVTTLPVRYTVKQDGNKLTVITTIADEQGTEKSYTENLVFGGGITETTTPSGAIRRTKAEWNADSSGYIITSNSITDDGQRGQKIIATWTLADKGKTLVISRAVEQANGLKYSIKGYYDHQ